MSQAIKGSLELKMAIFHGPFKGSTGDLCGSQVLQFQPCPRKGINERKHVKMRIT